MSPPVLLATLLALAGFHLLVLAQIQKCGFSCEDLDNRVDPYANVLLEIDFTPDNIMECEYGFNPKYKCRYNGTTGEQISTEGWCRPALGPHCGPSHPAGTVCYSACEYKVGSSGPFDEDIFCDYYCHYDQNSGVLTKADHQYYNYYTLCPGLAPYTECGVSAAEIPSRWEVAVPCAVDNTGIGADVFLGNIAIPVGSAAVPVNNHSLGVIYACLGHCGKLGYSFAAMENATTCYCSSYIAQNITSVDPVQCQTRCPFGSNGYANWSCGGERRLQVYRLQPNCLHPQKCPHDLTGANGTLITVESALFKCAYPSGSCTWFIGNGTLRNNNQLNCPGPVYC